MSGLIDADLCAGNGLQWKVRFAVLPVRRDWWQVQAQVRVVVAFEPKPAPLVAQHDERLGVLVGVDDEIEHGFLQPGVGRLLLGDGRNAKAAAAQQRNK